MSDLIKPELALMLWTLLTFGLLLVLLRVFAWKPLLGIIEERERTIRDSMESARRSSEDAEAALEENRKILAEARKAAGEIIQKGESEAGAVKTGILERARAEQEDLLRRGREEIERETRSAVREIRGVAADLALAAAEKLIGTRMDEDIHRKLVERYLEDLDQDGSSQN